MKRAFFYMSVLVVVFWPMEGFCQEVLFPWGESPAYVRQHEEHVLVGQSMLYEISYLDEYRALQEYKFQNEQLQSVSVFPFGREVENPQAYHREFIEINKHLKHSYGDPTQPDVEYTLYEWRVPKENTHTVIHSSYGGRWIVNYFPFVR